MSHDNSKVAKSFIHLEIFVESLNAGDILVTQSLYDSLYSNRGGGTFVQLRNLH